MRKLLFAAAAAVLYSSICAASTRTVEATYTATLSDIPRKAEKITIWIPLPHSTELQTISDVKIDSPYHFTISHEKNFDNDFAYATIDNPAPAPVLVKVTFRATRKEALLASVVQKKASKAYLEENLQANRLVTLSPRMHSLAAQITAGKKDSMSKAHAIYDYLVSTMAYDKTKPGWGKGDSERACDVKAGNCSDFHSLFISLARASGIPARFVIGFPMSSRPSGEANGYHCWAEFWVDGRGWIPVDASEASKSSDPKKREYLFGNLDPDRVQFTVGRDLTLKPKTAEPLNFFIYPYGEANGQPAGVPSVTLSYQDVQTSAPSSASLSSASGK